MVSLAPNLKKTEELGQGNYGQSSPSLQKHRISSLAPPRREESFLQLNETDEGPISIADKPVQLHEKEEGSRACSGALASFAHAREGMIFRIFGIIENLKNPKF